MGFKARQMKDQKLYNNFNFADFQQFVKFTIFSQCIQGIFYLIGKLFQDDVVLKILIKFKALKRYEFQIQIH
jgi:hypothetical protein